MRIEKECLNESFIDHKVLTQLEKDVGIETLARLMQLFIDELGSLNARLSDAITKSNIDEIHSVVHILKNSAAQFGATRLAVLTQKLHDTANISTEQQLSAAFVILQSIERSRLSYQDLVNTSANQGDENDN